MGVTLGLIVRMVVWVLVEYRGIILAGFIVLFAASWYHALKKNGWL